MATIIKECIFLNTFLQSMRVVISYVFEVAEFKFHIEFSIFKMADPISPPLLRKKQI